MTEPLFAMLETSLGRLVVRLFEDEAPATVAHFAGLATGARAWIHPATGRTMANAPLYDGTLVHRREPNFMAQFGDPFSRADGDAARLGEGGPGFTIPDEIRRTLRFDRPGRVAMATLRRPDTNGSQFFVTEVALPHLNFRHTIFGEVVHGFERVPKLTRAKEAPRLERVTLARGKF